MMVLPFVLLAIFLVTIIIDTRRGILLAVLIRPVIDCYFEARYAVVGIKPTEMLGILLPTVVLIKMLASREYGFGRAPLSFLWIVYIFLQLFGTALIMTVGGDVLLGVSYFFRAFNGFIGFFLFQEFFRTRNEFRILLLVHLAAGIVPLGMSVYQNLLGGVIRTEETIGGLVRNIGLYHDAYTLRLYCFQTLTALILYWCYYLRGAKVVPRAVLLVVGGIALMTIYKLFSKAGYMVFAAWFLTWTLARRQLLVFAGVVIGVLAIATLSDSRWYEAFDTVYSKEFDAMAGKENSDRLFQGRVGGWKRALQEFDRYPLPLKLVGDGSPHTGAHNDFLRALLGTGILGLVMYLVLLGSIGYHVFRRSLRDNSPLNVMALMLIVMWLVDAMGLVPGAYPGYQIYVWGFVGLALRGVEGLEHDSVKCGEDPESDAAHGPITLRGGNQCA